MDKLQWISEKDLDKAIDHLCKSAKKALDNAENTQKKNKIDPFRSLLIANTFKIKQKSELLNIQDMTVASHAISMAIGKFHQDILGFVDGWQNHNAGYDLENPEKKILAEIKNKHNTMNSKSRKKTIGDLEINLQSKNSHWKGYLVCILPESPKPYKNILEKLGNNKELYEIDGMSFYEMVTGDKNALNDLFDILILCDRLKVDKEVTSYCKEIIANNYDSKK